MKTKLKFLSITAVLLTMLVIILFSAQTVDQSDKLSRGFADLLLRIVRDWLPDFKLSLSAMNHLLRKSAHFSLFFLLGLLWTNALRRSGLRHGASMGLAWIICVLFAFTDEAHQLFVYGRGAQLRDVAIDSTGATFGILAYLILSRMLHFMNKVYQKRKRSKKLL